MTIEGKLFGRGQALFPSFELSCPTQDTLTLAELIERVVREQVAAFHQRQESRSVLTALSAEAIAAGLAAGKVAPQLPEGTTPQIIDEAQAIANALTAFEDGLFFVFLNDVQCERLEQPLVLHSDSRLTFLRLVALAGG